jgi:predicted AlkP superfamily pyrophosphatase or phosphodiesterase
MLTGVRPDQHGILANAGGPPDPALSYWSATKIKAPTLTQCLAGLGRTIAAVNWPVTVDAKINWNLPEVYARRNGDSSDMDTVDKFGTPGLVAEIGRTYPSFPQQWLDDRSRTLATIFLLQQKQPDLMLLHLAELDSEAHEEGPFTPHVNAVVERSDELIGDILKALPKDYDLALVSDHGFERVDRIANLKVLASADGVTGAMTVTGGLVTTNDPAVAAWLRGQAGKGDVGREVPPAELTKYAPQLSGMAFEPAPHVMFAASGEAHSAPKTKGNHGFWPTRPDYHSIFLLSGPGVKPGKLGTIEMVSLEDHLTDALGISCPKQ